MKNHVPFLRLRRVWPLGVAASGLLVAFLAQGMAPDASAAGKQAATVPVLSPTIPLEITVTSPPRKGANAKRCQGQFPKAMPCCWSCRLVRLPAVYPQ